MTWPIWEMVMWAVMMIVAAGFGVSAGVKKEKNSWLEGIEDRLERERVRNEELEDLQRGLEEWREELEEWREELEEREEGLLEREERTIEEE